MADAVAIKDRGAAAVKKIEGKSSLSNLSQETLVFATTIVIFAACALFVNGFATLPNISTLARSVSVLGILGVGMTVVVIGRGLDLSQVAVLAICAAWSLKLIGLGYGLAAGITMGLGLAVAIGAFNGFAISIIGIPALFTTLASGTLVYGVGRWLMLDGIITYAPDNQPFLLALGQGEVLGIPVPLAIFAVVALIGHFILSRTSAGRFVYAFGDNAEAARLTGVSVRVLTIGQYAFSAAVAFLAGLVTAGSVASINTNVFSSSLIFDVLLIVVLGGVSLSGGRGSIASVLAGTALIGTLLNAMILLDVQGDVQNIVKSVVLLGAITLDRKLHPRDEETARQGDL
ncbi:ABC transporter permease [Mesorhizobium sp. B3-1-9]|uniref:ABC transporter permease n=1 Tax=unclassified Mesorhizobium TaxID=325217 RepID=UPI00112780C3|nr:MULTISPECIES: ABC transporter permease [unclassified Mesorhizobium]TPI38134.1 ABC transporter permease [Mesorhizobium sp. B3-1-9]TPI69531.1 ABC transporter permease [Mesorhizobium sp. B3-1-8]TPI73797.1 ABC transporter permease [Mesorhizobium sp. B3-1-3]